MGFRVIRSVAQGQDGRQGVDYEEVKRFETREEAEAFVESRTDTNGWVSYEIKEDLLVAEQTEPDTKENSPEVVLTVTVDETGKVNITGKATDHSTLKALGVELVCMSERARIKAAL